MDELINTIPKLKIGYPRKPGFIMRSYEILEYLKRRFVLTGSLHENSSDRFTVTLDELLIYSCPCVDAAEIDIEKITSVLSRYRSFVEETERRATTTSATGEETDSEQWNDCFCSGE